MDEELKQNILYHLSGGEEHAIHKKDLARSLNLKTETEIRRMRMAITEMRQAGVPVLSSQKGYYLAKDLAELQAARRFLLSYIKSLCIDLRDIRRLEKQFTGQLTLKF